MADGAVIFERCDDGAFRQAEILSSVTQLKRTMPVDSTPLAVDLVNHPYAIIISQDCDLDLDFRARMGLNGPNDKPVSSDKKIPNILLCEVVTAEQLRGLTEVNSTLLSRIKDNNDVRYHFFQKVDSSYDRANTGLPEMATDFKRYFTIPADELYAQLAGSIVQRRTRLKSPYCEHFSTRFSHHLCRIALPLPHLSEASADKQ